MKLGPYYKGSSYTEIKVRIQNFTNEIITCKYHQKNQIKDLYFENEKGFLNLIFPIDQIIFDYNGNTEFHFIGTIDFYGPNSKESFKEISYNICLLFVSPINFFKFENNSIAIKDGKAQILPYYVFQNSSITIESIPYSKIVEIIELPENTAKRPTIRSFDNKYSINLPLIEKEQNHLAAQFDFSISKEYKVPISVNLDIKTNKARLFIYCDSKKDFIENDAVINIGNLWRNIYVLIVYFNPNRKTAYANFKFDPNISKFYEIQQIETIELKPYFYSVEIVSFKARLIKKPNKRMTENKKLEVNIENTSTIAQFYLNLDYIFIDTKQSKISVNKYLNLCTYWDGNKFVKYNKNDIYNARNINIIVSPISYDIRMKKSKILPSIIFDEFGEFKYLQNFQGIEFEILVIDPYEYYNQIKIITLPGNKIRHNYKNPLQLFGRIKGKPNTVFPLFGISSDFVNFDISKYDQKNTILYEFKKWTDTLLIDRYTSQDLIRINYIYSEKRYEITSSFYSSVFNFAFIISYLVPHMENLQYLKLILAIKEFTNLDTIFSRYNSGLRYYDLNFKFISFITSLFDTISVLYNDIKFRLFLIDFSIENILEEQERQMKVLKLDKSSAEISKTYITMKNQNYIESYNKTKRDEFIKKGYTISQYAKWTLENQFQGIQEEEYLKYAKIYDENHQNKVKLGYSNDNILPDFSFNNMNSISNVYNIFDSILTAVYKFTISLHDCIIKNDLKQLQHNVKILNQFVSFFKWARCIKDYSPYPSFFNKFFSAYQSMMHCLIKAGIRIRKDYLVTKENNISLENENDDYIIKPSRKINFKDLFFSWKQLGKNTKTELNIDSPKNTKI